MALKSIYIQSLEKNLVKYFKALILEHYLNKLSELI